LGDQHGLAPSSLAGRLWVHQLQLTIADLVAEIHDTHHPIASALYYKDQKDAAKQRSARISSPTGCRNSSTISRRSSRRTRTSAISSPAPSQATPICRCSRSRPGWTMPSRAR
jgi:hypothetical protein